MNLEPERLNFSYEVVCLDNFSTGHHRNIAGCLENPVFTPIEGDIRNLAGCKAVNGPSLVLHEATLGLVLYSINEPIIKKK